MAIVTILSALGGYGWYQRDQLAQAQQKFDSITRVDAATRPQLENGRELLTAGKFNDVLELTASLLPSLQDEPALAVLRQQAERLQAEARQLATAAVTRKAEQDKLAQFLEHGDDALKHDAGITGLDSKVAAAHAQAATQQALALYAVDPQAATGLFRLAPLPVDLADKDRALVRSRCYELLRAQGVPAAAARQATGYDQTTHSREAFLEGLERYRRQDLAAAREHLHQALQDDPGHFWAHLLVAVCHLLSDPPAPRKPSPRRRRACVGARTSRTPISCAATPISFQHGKGAGRSPPRSRPGSRPRRRIISGRKSAH